MTDQSNDYLSNINGNQQQLPNATLYIKPTQVNTPLHRIII